MSMQAPPSTPHAHRTLARHLATLPFGAIVTADTWREAHEPAQLNSAEIGGALRWADGRGYLRKVWADDTTPASVPSTWPPNKGRRVAVYARTTKPIDPEEVRAA